MAQSKNPHWTVGEVHATTEKSGGPMRHGFNIVDDKRKPRLALSYKTREEAEKARMLIEQAIANATNVK